MQRRPTVDAGEVTALREKNARLEYRIMHLLKALEAQDAEIAALKARLGSN